MKLYILYMTDYLLHSAVHAARPDIRCAIYIGCNPVVAVSSLKAGLLPLTNDAAVLGEVALHTYTGGLNEPEEKEKLIRSLGPISKVLLLTNHGALCCGETIEEAFYAAYHIVQVCNSDIFIIFERNWTLCMAESTCFKSRKPSIDGAIPVM